MRYVCTSVRKSLVCKVGCGSSLCMHGWLVFWIMIYEVCVPVGSVALGNFGKKYNLRGRFGNLDLREFHSLSEFVL